MKTLNLYFLNNKQLYSLSLIMVVAFTTVLALGFTQVSLAQAENIDTEMAAQGQGAGGGGQGAGGGGQGGGGGGGDGGQGGGGGGENGGGEGEEEVQGNNLSFPAIAVDGYVISPIASSSFTVVYDGPYTDLSAEELAALEGGTWYAQKTEGNTWQAEYTTAAIGSPVDVFGVDWGDNIEAINPIVGNPFRIEVGLYNKPELSMLGYTMALLANPSSPNEVQGTDTTTYDSEFAVVVSEKPTLNIQNITNVCTTNLDWSGTAWTLDGVALDEDSVSFAPELNVGGKYVYGASQGGWRPDSDGMYRLTMSMPGSDISLADAVIGNYTDWVATATSTEEEEEARAAIPMIDVVRNLTYVDVIATGSGGGGNPGDPGTDTYDPCAVVVDDTPATSTDPVVTEDDDESSGSSGGGGGSSRNATPTVAGASTLTQEDIDYQKSVILNHIRLVNVEYVKLLTLINDGSPQGEIDQQRAVVMEQIRLVHAEYARLLQMLLNRIADLTAQLQARRQ